MATSAEEEAVFDRQTRLWGADAQKRIRMSRVLIRGKFHGICSELCKNLVLAGVNICLFLENNSMVKDETDVIGNIFLRPDDVGKEATSQCVIERIQEMNPFAEVKLFSVEKDKLSDFKLVVSCDESFLQIEEIGKQCRSSLVPFIAVKSAGTLSLTLLDMGKEYVFQQESSKDTSNKQVSYATISEILQFDKWNTLPKGRTAFPFGIYAMWVCRELEVQEAKSDEENNNQKKKVKQVSRREKILDIIHSRTGKQPIAEIEKVMDDIVAAVDIIRRGASIAPVCTINGGLVGQEVLKVVSGKGEPVNNIMFFDALEASACVRKISAATC